MGDDRGWSLSRAPWVFLEDAVIRFQVTNITCCGFRFLHPFGGQECYLPSSISQLDLQVSGKDIYLSNKRGWLGWCCFRWPANPDLER